MKLTQRTIFQCFDKSHKESPVLIDEDIIECEPDAPLSEAPLRQPDFLLPVHVRQKDAVPENDIVPLLTHWKLFDRHEDSDLDLSRKCHQIGSSNTRNELHSPKLHFQLITAHARQMELFQRYTNDELSSYAQSAIDWQTMFQHLIDYRQKAIEQNQHEQLPWTEVYRPHHVKTYLGYHTKPVRRLCAWFLHWTKKLNSEKPKQIGRKGRKRTRDHDDSSDEDFIDESNMMFHNRSRTKQDHPQVIFIHGCGTTSLVHALADEHNFKVTEINGSQPRARALLLKQLEQVTSHHYLSLKRCASDTTVSSSKPTGHVRSPVKKKAKNERGTITSFFQNKNDESKENDSHSYSSVQVEKASLILFDEIETLTADDNFWSCLKKLLETAKKPMILTSNSRSNPEDAMFNLSKIGDYEMIHLDSNEPELIYCYLRLVLLVEMLEVPSLDDLITLFQSCMCDLRRTLLTLQFLAQSSSTSASSSSTSENRRLNQPTLQSSRLFDTMRYSYLAEQWDESILKTLFDDLTQKYTSDYEQSHLVLGNQRKNDSKRIELYDTLKMFMQEQEVDSLGHRAAFSLDYRPYIRQMCQSEQVRAAESTSSRRLRHCLSFRGCSLQWSDFAVLSNGLG